MKLKKLYTLSQFVDLLDSNSQHQEKSTKFYLDKIVKYNDFLKQPIKKEMLFNELEMPVIAEHDDELGIISAIHDQQLGKYKEAESKVIFKRVEKLSDELFLVHVGGGCYENLQFIGDRCMSFDSLGELAELSDGDINLKNVEI